MITLYGIKNCDTVRKARRWLDEAGIDYRFQDFRADGLDEGALRRWCEQLGWEHLLNHRATTFRQLPDSEKHSLDEARAIELMMAQPTLIKRPVLENGAKLSVGFSEERYRSLIV